MPSPQIRPGIAAPHAQGKRNSPFPLGAGAGERPHHIQDGIRRLSLFGGRTRGVALSGCDISSSLGAMQLEGFLPRFNAVEDPVHDREHMMVSRVSIVRPHDLPSATAPTLPSAWRQKSKPAVAGKSPPARAGGGVSFSGRDLVPPLPLPRRVRACPDPHADAADQQRQYS